MSRAEKVKTSMRRMGPEGSTNWHAMLDGAEDILREEGYAALTSRNIAERIGVKQRLVYYYFQTMDDLIVAMFRRLSVRELERSRQALKSNRPLREIWDVCIHTSDARLISEFMALANRIDELKTEVVNFIEESRALQVRALSAAFKRKSKGRIPPVGLALLAASVALSLNREGELGIKSGHREIKAAIDAFFSEVEPD
jgi:AcrR family transcriptional regulator